VPAAKHNDNLSADSGGLGTLKSGTASLTNRHIPDMYFSL